jgi:polyhydroxyalkanoate synthesis regulator phasin
MRKQKTIAAVAMTAALAGGALIGSTLSNPLASGAQDGASTTTTAPKTSTDPGPGERGPRGPGGGFDLDVAAKTLGVTTDELRTQLEAGKSLADVAKAQGVDKQKLIDALVKAGEARLDEAKAALPDRVAELVDATHKGGPGGPGFGGPGGPDGQRGPGGRGGPSFAVAAKALGISEDDLKTALQDGKTIAEVAKEKGVDKQKVIDALVADAKARSAEAVKSGKITQAEADEHLKDLTDHITTFVDEGMPRGGPRGDHDGPPPGDDGTATPPGTNGGN